MKPILIKQLIAFCVLMENNNGILEKAPLYVLEKYQTSLLLEKPEQLLDQNNLAKYKEYLKRWRVE